MARCYVDFLWKSMFVLFCFEYERIDNVLCMG